MQKRKIALEPVEVAEASCRLIRLTPADQAYLHTYYDVSPWSPSGRYVACLHLPFDDRPPGPDDAAELCLIDLAEGSIEAVYRTCGWGTQTGAHAVWGRTDRYLYLNDKRQGRPVGLRLDLTNRQVRYFDGPIWQVCPDESFAISPCLIRANATQRGYGVTVGPQEQISQPAGANPDDGLYRVDLQTGQQRLMVSLAEIYQALPDRQDLAGGTFYGFHAKFNRQGTRILFVVRVTFADRPRCNMVVTMRSDGSELRLAVPHRLWARGGHHPIWHPDGEHILMNLTPDETGMHFCQVRYDGTDLRILLPKVGGCGHPSFSPDGRHIVTDATGPVRILLLDVEAESVQELCRLETIGPQQGELRCDPHPAWKADGSEVLFAARHGGPRQLFIADLRELRGR